MIIFRNVCRGDVPERRSRGYNRENIPLEARFRSVKNRSGTKFKRSFTALSLSAGVFQGPPQDYFPCCTLCSFFPALGEFKTSTSQLLHNPGRIAHPLRGWQFCQAKLRPS